MCAKGHSGYKNAIPNICAMKLPETYVANFFVPGQKAPAVFDDALTAPLRYVNPALIPVLVGREQTAWGVYRNRTFNTE